MHQPPFYFPLDYYRVSPVRGHLEPYDPASPRNWRYIQTTDTPNELKVLLPPTVASQYDQLLKIELAELGKRPSVSWERILEIRHLKDRMIRKCQRLSRIIPPKRLGRGEPFVFQTLLAPEDFRLKEMEAWFQQDARSHKTAPATSVKSRPVVHRPAAQKGIARNTCCTRCSRSTTPAPVVSDDTKSQRADHQLHEHHVHEQKTRSTDTSQTPTPERSPSPESPSSPETDADPTFPDPSPSAAEPEPDPPQVKLSEDNDGSSSDSSTVAPTPPPSPPPLPHLLRISNPSLLKDILHLEPETVDFIPAIDEIPSPPMRPSPPPVQLRPTLGRQRSCIKRASGDSVKTVSWADDHNVADQIAKIAFFTAESPVEEPEHQERSSDEDEDEDEDDGTDAMSRIDSLHLELKKSLEEAEADPAHFQLIESLISDHKQKMRNGIAHEGFPSALLEQVLEVDDEDSKLGDSDFDDI